MLHHYISNYMKYIKDLGS